MKVNGKKILGALGLMSAGALLAMVEMARELTVGKNAQENRKAWRIMLDGYENGTLDVKPQGIGKCKVSAMYFGEAPDYTK